MPDLDLDPGEYHERKPKGWRWKLPWSHPEDNKLPAVTLVAVLGGLVLLYLYRGEINTAWSLPLAAGLGAAAGIMFTLACRD